MCWKQSYMLGVHADPLVNHFQHGAIHQSYWFWFDNTGKRTRNTAPYNPGTGANQGDRPPRHSVLRFYEWQGAVTEIACHFGGRVEFGLKGD